MTGPLTQRLVSALMDENTMPEGTDSGSENTSSDLASNRSSFVPAMRNGILIERRVRKELIEQGILDGDDVVKEEDDEILSEIVRVRTELAAISDYNSNELRKLYAVAKEEMSRLEIKRKLDVIDQEVRADAHCSTRATRDQTFYFAHRSSRRTRESRRRSRRSGRSANRNATRSSA